MGFEHSRILGHVVGQWRWDDYGGRIRNTLPRPITMDSKPYVEIEERLYPKGRKRTIDVTWYDPEAGTVDHVNVVCISAGYGFVTHESAMSSLRRQLVRKGHEIFCTSIPNTIRALLEIKQLVTNDVKLIPAVSCVTKIGDPDEFFYRHVFTVLFNAFGGSRDGNHATFTDWAVNASADAVCACIDRAVHLLERKPGPSNTFDRPKKIHNDL